jgi:hypothetical protein
MSSSDEQPNAEPQEVEDLELDGEQSEGVQGGFALQSQRSKSWGTPSRPPRRLPGRG